MSKYLVILFMLLVVQMQLSAKAINSIETGYTIMQVRTMVSAGQTYLVGTSYEGTVVCYAYDGTKMWENKLSGYMNNDICCADVDKDGKDEVLVANSDGYIYCIDDDGNNLWSFMKNDAPMNAVCMVSKDNINYIACGGYDKNVYYLSSLGQEIKHFASSSYGIDKQEGKYDHTMNFMRCIKQNGNDVLVVHSALNTNWAQGTLYYFNPLEVTPFKKTTVTACSGTVYGTFAVNDLSADSTEIILGGNALSSLDIAVINAVKGNNRRLDTKTVSKDIGSAGYRMASIEAIPNGSSFLYYVLFGDRMILVSPDAAVTKAEVLAGNYAFNGMCKDAVNNKIILASAQSGGSCIHVIDYTDAAWKNEFKVLVPPGKITKIVNNTASFRTMLNSFTKPSWERTQVEVNILDGGAPASRVAELAAINPKCPAFIDGTSIYPHVENWDRSTMANTVYRDKRDTRKTYDYTGDQVVTLFSSSLTNAINGIQFWSGHGTDPYYYSLPTLKRTIDAANGKYVVPVFAEMESYDSDFQWMINDLIYPLADYMKTRNGLISLRNKHLFWQSIVYTPAWSRLVSGEFANVFVSSMEESNSKTMDMSVSGRMGLWTSGAMNRWGTRFTRDNPCYDRLRQLSYQRLPNHALRMFVYNVASGATMVHNTVVDEEYQSVLWYMLAKGILFVPKCEEIVSINPVHLSMLTPDQLFLDGNAVKITTDYDQTSELANPVVVGRTSGAFSGGPVSEWDFSRYATGGNERRLEFLPPYPNGMVLTTPPNDATSLRGELTDHLNPIYKNIMQEIFTDGCNYYSDKNKTATFKADAYCATIKAAIQNGAEKLPLTVDGRVAWVTAQTAPLHLRLTLVDGGYVNPDDRTVTVNFHTAKVRKITNLLTSETIPFSSKSATVTVPCGLFTFLDIELFEELKVETGITQISNTVSKQIKIIGGNGSVIVIGAEGEMVKIYNLLGQTLNYQKIKSNKEVFLVKSGVVLVNVGVKTQKIIVM